MDVGCKDIIHNKLLTEIRERQQKLREEHKIIREKSKENAFLGTVLNDYNRYNDYIRDQAQKKYDALLKISNYLDGLIEQSDLVKENLESLKFDKHHILGKISEVRAELDEITAE